MATALRYAVLRFGRSAIVAWVTLGAVAVWSLEPPTPEQRERYRRDGSLTERSAAARAIGNHRLAPELAARVSPRAPGSAKSGLGVAKRLPSIGTQKVLALLISFADAPGHNDPSLIHSQLFGDGVASDYPTESLRNFYRRSSHGLLELDGDTLGWYQTDYPRSAVPETTAGREALIREALEHFDAQGHDFSQYDNDGDGVVDYFLIFWSGRHQDWAEFWWGYQTSFQNDRLTLDGTRFGTYSWQWEAWDYPDVFSPLVSIHETGHALGLPDYYDYDAGVGPGGGVGGLDQMDGNWGDHNCFSKWLLGWLTPEAFNHGTNSVSLRPADTHSDAVVLMHGDLVEDAYAEYFMVEYRRRAGNDATYPTDGLLIWHVDARRGDNGRFLYDNSYTEHKLLRLMEADGLESITSSGTADAGDFYQPGSVFSSETTPSSHRHDGAPTNLLIDNITAEDGFMALRSDLGSGCALYCDVVAPSTAWPGIAASFHGDVTTANCAGAPSLLWSLGDGSQADAAVVQHSYRETAVFPWSFASTLADASCSGHGELLVCDDLRCWQWNEVAAMAGGRGQHAAVRLADGRILVVGGGSASPEIYDPATREWTPTAVSGATFGDVRGVLLDDGRALFVGSAELGEPDTAIFDPQTGLWRLVAALNSPRVDHSLLKLADGRVLAAGGGWADQENGAYDVLELEIFDPSSEAWTVVGEIPEAMARPGLEQIADGRVYLTGNRMGVLFDPASQSWGQPHTLIFERELHFSALLPDGRVLVGGGFDSRFAILHDPVTGKWSLTGPMNELRFGATATLLASGRVLVVGGAANQGLLSSAEIFDPATLKWTAVASPAAGRLFHTATELRDGSVLVTGGYTAAGTGFVVADTAERLARPAFPPRRAGGRH